MSVLRLENWLGQQRVDVPHLRGIDSGVLADFDLLAGTMLVNRTPFVLQGFNLIPLTAGVAATNLQISVAGSALFHPTATEVGTIFSTAVGRTVETLNATNARVVGGFTASTVNYIGVDLRRSADSTTSDLVQFLGATTLTESPQTVPLGRTLDYVIVIGTQDFSTTPTIAPLCKVTTDANNNIVTLEDARNMFGRLGKGGSVTNTGYTYPWPGGRTEVGNNSDFGAGDKAIPSLKDWMDAAMTRIWEVGGGERWYSAAMPHNVWMVRNGTVLFTNSDFFEWDGTHLHWREIRFTFSNSTGYFNDVADQLSNSAGLTDLADGQCIYADLDRTTNRTGGTAIVALKGTTATLGTPLVPGSRYILAWRSGTSVYARGNPYAIGTTFNPATTTTIGMVKLSVVSATPTAPVCFNPDVNNALTVSANAGGAAGVTASGNGSGAGVTGLGGGTSGTGVVGSGGTPNGNGMLANGTGNGNGIVANGNGTGYGVVGTGGATGIAILGNGATANPNPIVMAQDGAGNKRFAVDHVGYATCPLINRFEETWFGINGSTTMFINSVTLANVNSVSTSQTVYLNNRWAIPPVSANCNVQLIGGLGGTGLGPLRNDGGIDIFGSAAVALNAIAGIQGGAIGYVTGVSMVADFVLAFTQNNSAWNYKIGFTNAGTIAVDGSPITEDACCVMLRAADYTKLYLYTNNNGAGTQTVSTAAPVFTGLGVHVRLELHGSATPYGAVANLYINDVLAATTATTLPRNNQSLGFSVAAHCTTGGNAGEVVVGPVKIVWNNSLTGAAI